MSSLRIMKWRNSLIQARFRELFLWDERSWQMAVRMRNVWKFCILNYSRKIFYLLFDITTTILMLSPEQKKVFYVITTPNFPRCPTLPRQVSLDHFALWYKYMQSDAQFWIIPDTVCMHSACLHAKAGNQPCPGIRGMARMACRPEGCVALGSSSGFKIPSRCHGLMLEQGTSSGSFSL